jgi:hypothetical protein
MPNFMIPEERSSSVPYPSRKCSLARWLSTGKSARVYRSSWAPTSTDANRPSHSSRIGLRVLPGISNEKRPRVRDRVCARSATGEL